MSKILTIITLSALVYGCGEAGFGFDVAAELPIEQPFSFSTPDVPNFNQLEIDPPSEVISYSLNDVPEFQDAIDELNDNNAEVLVNAIYYQIDGIDSDEQLPLDDLTVDVTYPGGSIPITLASGGTFENVPKTEILTDNEKNQLVNALQNGSQIQFNVTFDVGNINTSDANKDINFDFIIFIDAGIRVRDINN